MFGSRTTGRTGKQFFPDTQKHCQRSVPGKASFDVFNPAISNAMFVPVAPGAKVEVPFQIVPAQLVKTPTRGLMVVTQDNHSGGSQANLLRVELDD